MTSSPNSGGEQTLIAYLDTSAVVPLLVSEPSSAACRRVWDDADTIVSCRLLYLEASAALGLARRMTRLTSRDHASTVATLDDLWTQIDVIEVDDPLVHRAAYLAHRYGLRGYDAVHCAGAEQLADSDLVAVAGDQQLLKAWHRLGLSTVDANAAR